MYGPAKCPTEAARRTMLERIRGEFRQCCASPDADAYISAAELAQYLYSLADNEHRRISSRPLGDLDKQVIALHAAEHLQAMDLTGDERVSVEEWVHSMLMQQFHLSWLKAGSQVDALLRAVLQQHPTILMDLQKIFRFADLANEGLLTFTDVVETYIRKQWHFSPSHHRGILSDAELANCDPEVLARDVMKAMDLDGHDSISYAEFMVYCLGRRKQEVTLHFYDLTNGAAAALSPWLLGKRLEGLWHTGVQVFGKEYYFGGDIFYDTPAGTAFGEPLKRIPLGFTLWRQEELHNFIVDELRPVFNRQEYDVVSNNCNHFADRLCLWLTGRRIPGEVVQQPESLMRLPAVKVLKPLLNHWLGNIETGTAMVGTKEAREAKQCGAAGARSRGPLEPGTLVGVLPLEGDGQPILGIACGPSEAQAGGGAVPVTEAPAQAAAQDWVWVRSLAIAPCSAEWGSRAALRTERLPRARVVPMRLEDACSESLYLDALRATSPSAPPVLSLAMLRSGTARSSGGASSGLKPSMSRPPGSMFAEDSPPASPSPTPRRAPRRTAEEVLGQAAAAGAVAARANRSLGCSPSSFGSTLGRATMSPIEDLAVPAEARLCLQFQPSTRGGVGPRGGVGHKSQRSAMVVDLHRRRRGRSMPERQTVVNL